MSEIKNIRGEFSVELKGQTRTLKATFGAIEQLEEGLFGNKCIMDKLIEAQLGRIAFRDVVSVLTVGLSAAGDTRMTRAEIGQAVLDQGLQEFLSLYVEYLSYCINGGHPSKAGASGEGQAVPVSQ